MKVDKEGAAILENCRPSEDTFEIHTFSFLPLTSDFFNLQIPSSLKLNLLSASSFWIDFLNTFLSMSLCIITALRSSLIFMLRPFSEPRRVERIATITGLSTSISSPILFYFNLRRIVCSMYRMNSYDD